MHRWMGVKKVILDSEQRVGRNPRHLRLGAEARGGREVALLVGSSWSASSSWLTFVFRVTRPYQTVGWLVFTWFAWRARGSAAAG